MNIYDKVLDEYYRRLSTEELLKERESEGNILSMEGYYDNHVEAEFARSNILLIENILKEREV